MTICNVPTSTNITEAVDKSGKYNVPVPVASVRDVVDNPIWCALIFANAAHGEWTLIVAIASLSKVVSTFGLQPESTCISIFGAFTLGASCSVADPDARGLISPKLP
jgi:hypothetical protein